MTPYLELNSNWGLYFILDPLIGICVCKIFSFSKLQKRNYSDFNFCQNFNKRLEQNEDIPQSEVKQETWKSQTGVASGLFTEKNRPQTIQKLYETCEEIPKVHIMDVFREDGLASKTLYSDHQFFFRILKNQIERMLLKEQEVMKQEIEARKKRKKMAKDLEKSKKTVKTANRKRVSQMKLVFDK